MAGDCDIIPVTTGAMTNLAVALTMERRLVKKIPRIVSMAGEFKMPFAEWNILCDPEAAHLVFSSGIPMDVITFDIGQTVKFDPGYIDQLEHSPRPLAKRLAAAIAAWTVAHVGGRSAPMPSLFDPMAIAAMIEPDLCTWKSGHIGVELQGGQTYGFTGLTESPVGEKGIHRVAWDTDRAKALDFYMKRVLAV